jgi:hypothetical protein
MMLNELHALFFLSINGVPRAFDATFRYKKELPNGADFIVLEQRVRVKSA